MRGVRQTPRATTPEGTTMTALLLGELFARTLLYTVGAIVLVGAWDCAAEDARGRAIDVYLNGVQGVIYL